MRVEKYTKEFIESHMELIRQNDFPELYAEIDDEYAGNFTETMYHIGLNPLENMQEIPDRFLSDSNTITEFIVPKSIRRIGYCSFASTDLKTIQLPDTLERIDEYAFAFSNELEKIELPESVSWLGEFAFDECTSLKQVVLSPKLTRIQFGTFHSCYDLKKLELPKSITLIETNAFADCEFDELIYHGTLWEWDNNVDKDLGWNKGFSLKKLVCVDSVRKYE